LAAFLPKSAGQLLGIWPGKMARTSGGFGADCPSFELFRLFLGQYPVPPFLRAFHAMKDATNAMRTLAAAAGKQTTRFQWLKFVNRFHLRVNKPG
jgi:hypothetical protein